MVVTLEALTAGQISVQRKPERIKKVLGLDIKTDRVADQNS